MERRIDYRKRLESNKKKKRIAKIGVLSAFGIIGVTGASPAFASEWTANSPESIQIEQGAISYTMKQGDTLWAIGMKLNINVNTLASVNNIDLSSGQQYSLPVGTVINFSESEIKAVNSNGQTVNEGVKVNDSNKIVADKPIGTDVSKDVATGTASSSDIIGQPDNTGNLLAPNNDGGTQTGSTEQETPSTGGDTGTTDLVDPSNPVEPEKPTETTNEDKFVVINVDTDGNVLDSTDGYTFVSESTDKKVETLDNGNTVTTYTTTKVWKKDEGTPPVNNHYVGQVLYTSKGFTSTAEAQAHMLAVSAKWWDYADANGINVDISWAGGNPYYVTVVVSEIY